MIIRFPLFLFNDTDNRRANFPRHECSFLNKKKKERKKLPFSLNIDLDKANSRSRFTFRFSINTGEEIYIYIFLSPEIIIRIYSHDHVDKFTFYDKSESAISVNQSEKKKWLGFEKVSNLGKCCTNLVRYGFILQPLDNPYTLFPVATANLMVKYEIPNSQNVYIYIHTHVLEDAISVSDPKPCPKFKAIPYTGGLVGRVW